MQLGNIVMSIRVANHILERLEPFSCAKVFSGFLQNDLLHFVGIHWTVFLSTSPK